MKEKNKTKNKNIFSNYRAGDFLIRIKNSAMARRSELSLTNTKFIHALALSLKEEGFLNDVKLTEGILTVQLAQSHKLPLLMDLRLVSKPGLRVYKSVSELKKRKVGSSILILSTPSGIMSGKKAIKNNLGGEVIVEIW